MAYSVMTVSHTADDFGGEGTGGGWSENGYDENHKSQYRTNLWD